MNNADDSVLSIAQRQKQVNRDAGSGASRAADGGPERPGKYSGAGPRTAIYIRRCAGLNSRKTQPVAGNAPSSPALYAYVFG